MTTWKSFLTRAASAIVALAIMIGLYVYLAADGLKITVGIAVLIGAWELSNILFHNEKSRVLKVLFYALCWIVFIASIFSLAAGSLVVAMASMTMIIASLLMLNKNTELSTILAIQAKSALGLLYMGLLPSFAFKIIEQPAGVSWFVFLLAAVFAGDTMAYVFGVLIGRNKVMPSVSPKKTWEGSIGGIFGSFAAGVVCWLLLFPENTFSSLALLAVVAGFVGQFGDFFESLLKRVADVKDSGKIMPGHGGVLDRIDGVLFASPVILSGILILSHLLS